jgi:hypothetical protein
MDLKTQIITEYLTQDSGFKPAAFFFCCIKNQTYKRDLLPLEEDRQQAMPLKAIDRLK